MNVLKEYREKEKVDKFKDMKRISIEGCRHEEENEFGEKICKEWNKVKGKQKCQK